ncbi:MAG: hypothetical protein ABJH07_09605 [Sedimentitalea sp.]|uniref:hypothetical protein n=1 Tax=Sedimentitalea sp. TaxID=2048915 RepID=UPI003264DFAF
MAEWPARWGKYRFDATGIPAAYTYLGQLIAHDLTWNEATTTDSSVRFRCATLDFKSIFERATDLSPLPSVCDNGGLALGCTSAGRQGDLPRSPCGAPVLADTRNDQTLTLSQLVVLVTKFYQVFAARTADKTQAHLDARRHMQWIVLYDYLPRVIDPIVYGDVMQSQAWPLLGEGAGLIPIEFSAASFRLGHAMVRYRYPHWREGGGGASLKDLLRFTHHSAASRFVDVAGERRLPDDWTAGWSFLLPSEGESMQSSLSAAIDENLALDMFALPDSIGDCLASAPEPDGIEYGTFNLAEHTLVRGNRLCLGSAQSLCEFSDARLREAGGARLPRRLPTVRLSQTRSHSLSDFLVSDSAASLRTDTPLWFYFLREADIHASGQHFGPLASRITMETIFRAIRSDADGILLSNFKPDFSDERGKFGLKDLHEVVQTHWKPET